jgi:hypothetical protein
MVFSITPQPENGAPPPFSDRLRYRRQRALRCPRRWHRRSAQPRSSGSTFTPPLPLRCACATGSATKGRWVDGAGRKSPRSSVDGTGSQPTGRRLPHPTAGKRAVIQQPCHQSRWYRRPPCRRWKEPRPFPLKHLPVDQGGQLHQFVPRIDHIDQPRAKKVIPFRRARAMLHGIIEIAGFSLESYKSLQLEAKKTRLIQHKINEMAVVQCELPTPHPRFTQHEST